MKKDDPDVQITISRKHVYIALQSILEARDRMSESDIRTIMNADSSDLERLSDILMCVLKKAES
jgi:hypothetical protein